MSSVLVVDDFKPDRDRLRSLFTREGFEVRDVSDGRAAVEQAKRLKPDVVVLDYRMPEMDGIQTAYEIRQFAPKTKILFYTAFDSPETEAATRVMGGCAFVSKLAPGQVVLAVRQLLKGENVMGTRIGP
jgi:CheY-like chemotaxis protein